MKWVEKSSIEKIHRLLEISEQERHYQVLLTLENISAFKHNSTPYTLPVIPRPFPSHVVAGEHFVLADVRRLASGGISSSRDLVVEALSRVQEARSASGSLFTTFCVIWIKTPMQIYSVITQGQISKSTTLTTQTLYYLDFDKQVKYS